jgi:hypothetical protein
MTRVSLIALIAAAGLASAPIVASADCHLPQPEDTVGADHGPPLTEEQEVAAADEDILDDDELDAPEDSAILPSAEDHEESEAPTMEIDCEEHPELCVGDPILTESEGPALSEGDDPDDPTGANEPGEVVVAEPDC